MERLLKDAEKLTGKKYKLSSYADIVEAIHAIQTEMGITGTTQLEAEKTISGSISRLKASWSNFVTAMGEGDEKKLDKLVDDIVESAELVFENIMPVAEKIVYGFLHLVEASIPMLIEKLPGMLSRLSAVVVRVVKSTISSVSKSLPSLMSSIVKKLPQALKSVERFIIVWVGGAMGRLLSNLAGYKIPTNQSIFQNLFTRLFDLLKKASDKIREFWKVVVQPIVQDGAKLIQGLVEAVIHLLDGLKPIWDEVSPKISKAFQDISNYWSSKLYPILQGIVHYIITEVVPAVAENAPLILSIIGSVIAGIAAYNIAKKIGDVIGIVKNLFSVITAHPFALVIGAIVGLVAYLVHLYQTNEEARDKINAAFEAIKGFWENTLKPAFENIWDYVVNTVVPAVVKAWNEDFLPTIQTVFQAVAGFWEDTLKPALVALYDYVWRDLIPTLIVAWEYTLQPAIERVFGAIAGFWEETLKPAFVAIYDYVVRDLIPTLIVWWEYYLAPAIEGVFKGIKQWWDEYGSKALEAFRAFIDEKVVPIIETLGEKFQYLWDTWLKPVAAWLKDTFIIAWEGLQTQLGNLVDFVSGVFSGDWEKAWNALVEMVKTPFDTLGEILKTPINAVIDLINSMLGKVETAINSLINGINEKLHLHFEGVYIGWPFNKQVAQFDWQPNLQTVQWGRIARLANGGILGEGQSAFVGEYAPELLRVIGGKAMVTPLSKMPARFPGGTETFEPRVAQSRPVTVIMQVGEKEFGRLAFELGSAEEQRVGVRLAKGGAY